jgi:hypothetical protein
MILHSTRIPTPYLEAENEKRFPGVALAAAATVPEKSDFDAIRSPPSSFPCKLGAAVRPTVERPDDASNARSPLDGALDGGIELAAASGERSCPEASCRLRFRAAFDSRAPSPSTVISTGGTMLSFWGLNATKGPSLCGNKGVL